MLRIRLKRGGARNNPVYRIVVMEKTKKRDGEANDVLGYWHPQKNDLRIDKKKLEEWKGKGAEISEGVRKLIK